MRLLLEAARHIGPGRHPHLIASGAAGVPASPLWLLVLIGAVVVVVVGLYWNSTRA